MVTCVWCVGRLMSHHGNIIMIDAHCCISARLGWPQWKLILCRMECGPVTCHVSRTSEHWVWQRKGKNLHHLSWVFAPPFGGVYRYFIEISLAWSRFTPDQNLSWYRGKILTILIATIIRLIINYPPSHSVSQNIARDHPCSSHPWSSHYPPPFLRLFQIRPMNI